MDVKPWMVVDGGEVGVVRPVVHLPLGVGSGSVRAADTRSDGQSEGGFDGQVFTMRRDPARRVAALSVQSNHLLSWL